jgi:alanyl-tRNA synthetase
MGLERLMSVLEGKTDNYQTSLFSELKTGFIKYFPQSFLNEKTSEFTLRILADHIRSSVFMICDGVTPSNEERGYVLRRIIRRALRHAYIGGVKEPFLYKQVDSVISLMGDEYSELYRAKDFIKSALKLEEESFLKVLPDGLSILNKEIEKLGSAKILSGEIAFKLYDTYGFPVDITEDILQKYGIKIDYQGFNKEMEAQKTRSRESWSGSSVLVDGGLLKLSDNLTKTEFAGYNHTSLMAKILCFEKVENKTVIVFDKTPFYPEGGGQSCDVGVIENSAGKAVFNVEHVKKINGVIFHFGSVIGGADAMLTIGAQVNCVINQEVRKLHCQGHTATHILHYVLRQKFGNSIAQKGSLIERSGFRFDFSHPKALTDIEVIEVENVVNYLIRSNFNVTSFITDKQTAIKDGVTALFGEKYDDSVRVVKCGDSAELCGGTHVEYSGNIGLFKIISERGVSSGVRRIEAKVGFFALEYVNLIVKKYNDALLFQKLQQKLTSIYNIDWSGCLQNLSYSSGTSPSVSGLSVNFATVENELLANISDLKTKCKSLENRVDELIEDFIFERKVTFIKASNGFDIAVYEVNTSKHDIKSITKIIMSKKAIPFDSILVILNGIDCIFKTKTNDFDAINVLSRLKNGVPSGNKFCAIMKCNTSVDAVISGVLLG